MSFDLPVIGLILLAALLHAIWNTIVKTGRDGLLMFALIKAPTMVVGILVIAVVGPPSMASVPYALVIHAMTLTQLTHVAALRETSIIFAAIIGTLVLREPLGHRRIVAATVVTFGIIMVGLSAR